MRSIGSPNAFEPVRIEFDEGDVILQVLRNVVRGQLNDLGGEPFGQTEKDQRRRKRTKEHLLVDLKLKKKITLKRNYNKKEFGQIEKRCAWKMRLILVQ